jgi:hypothetical protein
MSLLDLQIDFNILVGHRDVNLWLMVFWSGNGEQVFDGLLIGADVDALAGCTFVGDLVG